MKYKLTPPSDICAHKVRFGSVPALVLKSKKHPLANPPGILWIHGGGYMLGMKEMVYMNRAVDLVRNHGAIVVSPGYRLSWQKPYPAALNDCYHTLLSMAKHADVLGFSKNQIMVGGESAGGGLTAAVCIKARNDGKVNIAYHMPLYPMLSNIDTESSRNNHGRVWNTRKNHISWKLYLRSDEKNIVSPYASPAHETDYSGLPPCYTFVGDGEPFYRETLDYVENLKKAGIKARVDVYHTNVHAFDMLKPNDRISQRAIKTFNKHFEYAMANYFAENQQI